MLILFKRPGEISQINMFNPNNKSYYMIFKHKNMSYDLYNSYNKPKVHVV